MEVSQRIPCLLQIRYLDVELSMKPKKTSNKILLPLETGTRGGDTSMEYFQTIQGLLVLAGPSRDKWHDFGYSIVETEQ